MASWYCVSALKDHLAIDRYKLDQKRTHTQDASYRSKKKTIPLDATLNIVKPLWSYKSDDLEIELQKLEIYLLEIFF